MITFSSFAKDIGFNEMVLDNYTTFSDEHYKIFEILKRDKNNKRKIASPSKELKAIQRWILNNYLYSIKVSKNANGFVKGKGIKQNAIVHLNKPFLLSIDIKDFFPSISQKMVYNSLKMHFEDKTFVFKVSKLCTFKRALPQGAPTSPMLSNIVFLEYDNKITSYCNSNLVNYSRYADDLVFSCKTKEALNEVYNFVKSLLYNTGFEINKKKTKYFSGKGRMVVTGININEGRITVGQDKKRILRSMIHRLIINNDKTININVVLGHLSFIKDIEPTYHSKMIDYIKLLKKKRDNHVSLDFNNLF